MNKGEEEEEELIKKAEEERNIAYPKLKAREPTKIAKKPEGEVNEDEEKEKKYEQEKKDKVKIIFMEGPEEK
jgi:hypothetical protein